MSFRNYYDTSSYGRSRDTSRSATNHILDRPTTVTAKYTNITPSYKSSSIPILCRDRSATRDETPITAIANRYSSYKTNKDDKPVSKYEKKDYTKLSLPSVTTNRSRDVSPVSTSSKYSLRPSRRVSPERKTKSSLKGRSPDPSPADRDKDIPSKTEKSTGYSSLSSYKIYPRSSSYTRPSSRAETKPEISVNRYAIANRLSSNYLRSPSLEKRTSVSPVNHIESPKSEIEKSVSPIIAVPEETPEETIENDQPTEIKTNENDESCGEETVTVITRHTSPTPPGSSVYVRTRRADMAKTIEKSIPRSRKRPQMLDKGIQSDRLDDPTRCSRFGSTARANVATWSVYTPSASSYTGYAGRYSTAAAYSNLRESNERSSSLSYNDRSSRSCSTEPVPKDNSISNGSSFNLEVKQKDHKTLINNDVPELNPEVVTVYEQNKDDDTSEIIINVNLKLKKAKSPSTELVSPEITITNSQLPPQPPKLEGTPKTKKVKVRKSSTDSSSDSGASSKKKIIKKRNKSSSTDSDQATDSNASEKSVSQPQKVNKHSSSASIVNGHTNLKHSKIRESKSNSPESSITLSTQSSISEDETISKSKTNDISRTSADELSIPTDRSAKQSSPLKNEGTEEAKSFLIRALAPVTNLFKRNQDSNESRWLETSNSESTGKDVSNLITESDKSKSKSNTDNIVASNDDGVVKLKAIRHIESGERAWWMDSDSERKNSTSSEKLQISSEKNTPKKIRHIESGERAWWLESNGIENKDNIQPVTNTASSDKPYKQFKFDDEKPWWLDSSANIPEGVERLTPPRKSSSESEKSEKFDFYKVRHIESGEKKDWWLTSSENSSSNKQENVQNSLSKSGSDQSSFPLRRIRHVESGERPWWLSSGSNIPEGIETLPTPPLQVESDSSDSEEVQAYEAPAQVPPFPLSLPDDEPLGDRRSPEGLETPKATENYRGRVSPYENNRQYLRRSGNSMGFQKTDKFISRYMDIDDILGTGGQIYSPFRDSVLTRRTGQLPYVDSDECEEIDSTQVKIHDSTAQRPVIKKLRSRSEIIDCREEDQLDDVALQVFKDGDYGPYLDLDSTLGEQEEELEGLQER